MQPCGLRDLTRPWGRRSFGLKTKRFAGYAHGTLAQRGLKNIHATLWAAGFGAPSGATVVWPQGRASCGMYPQNLSRKGAKKTIMQTCGLRKLAHPRGLRSFGLKTKRVAECVRRTLPERALKNNHTALRTAKMSTSSGATVVWPQDQTSCGLRPQRVSRKRHTPKPIDELGARQATFVGVTIISLVAEDDMINQLDTEERSGAGDAIGQGVVLPTGAGIA